MNKEKKHPEVSLADLGSAPIATGGQGAVTSSGLENPLSPWWSEAAPLTVQRLSSTTVAADVFDLLPEVAVEGERHVVVVVDGGRLLPLPLQPLAGAAAGLGAGQAEGSSPLLRLLLLGPRHR